MMKLSDHYILSHLDGLENSSLISILDINNNQLQVIKHSSYYDLDKFKNLVNEKKKIVCILSLNIESIYTKFDELEALIEELHNIMYSILYVYKNAGYLIRLILSIYNYYPECNNIGKSISIPFQRYLTCKGRQICVHQIVYSLSPYPILLFVFIKLSTLSLPTPSFYLCSSNCLLSLPTPSFYLCSSNCLLSLSLPHPFICVHQIVYSLSPYPILLFVFIKLSTLSLPTPSFYLCSSNCLLSLSPYPILLFVFIKLSTLSLPTPSFYLCSSNCLLSLSLPQPFICVHQIVYSLSPYPILLFVFIKLSTLSLPTPSFYLCSSNCLLSLSLPHPFICVYQIVYSLSLSLPHPFICVHQIVYSLSPYPILLFVFIKLTTLSLPTPSFSFYVLLMTLFLLNFKNYTNATIPRWQTTEFHMYIS